MGFRWDAVIMLTFFIFNEKISMNETLPPNYDAPSLAPNYDTAPSLAPKYNNFTVVLEARNNYKAPYKASYEASYKASYALFEVGNNE
jgi:hypothetical protein